GRLRVVVDDGAHPLAVGDGGVDRRVEVDEEGLGGLALGVEQVLHGDRVAGLTRGEDDGAAGGDVVGVGHRGGVVGGAVVDGDRLAAGVGQADGEVIAGGAAVALFPYTTLFRSGRLRVVVDDGAHPLAVGDGGVDRRVEVDEE